MNREIKLRAFNSKDKEMYGDGVAKQLLYKEVVGEPIPEHWSIIQYTGLKDENGTEIYEGDVISSTPYLPSNPDERIISIIVYRNDLGRWNAECFGNLIGETDHLYGILKPPHQTEIIGNIYEHPHLINHPL